MATTQILGWESPGVPKTYGAGSTGTTTYGLPVGGGTTSFGGSITPYGGSLGAALVPNATGLETTSSQDIASLLNPPSLFPDTSRQAAELSGARGIPGSSAAFGTGLRMTDEERLKRIALGENLLSAAYARTQPYAITPYQKSEIDIQKQYLDLAKQKGQLDERQYQDALNRLNTPTARYVGGSTPETRPQSGRGAPSPAPTQLPNYGTVGPGLDYGNVQYGGYQSPTSAPPSGGGDLSTGYGGGDIYGSGGYNPENAAWNQPVISAQGPYYGGAWGSNSSGDPYGSGDVYSGQSGDPYLDWIYGG